MVNAGTPEVEADIANMQAHALGVRACKWATYAASRSKLGQHLGGHRDFNCPLNCRMTWRVQLKRNDIMTQSSELSE